MWRDMKHTFVAEHEAAARAAYERNLKDGAFSKAWGRKSPRTWLATLGGCPGLPSIDEFPDQVMNRDDLRERLRKTADPKVSALLILAWGEMKVVNARSYLGNSDESWVSLAASLRDGELTRSAAYARFHLLAQDRLIPNLGPAYYTKLIYFLRPTDPDEGGVGFIMDRRTATSINLLFGRSIVKMDNGWVSARNTADEYENFNRLVEQIANAWRAPAEHVEMTLFGSSGTSAWREHVRKCLKRNRSQETEEGGRSS